MEKRTENGSKEMCMNGFLSSKQGKCLKKEIVTAVYGTAVSMVFVCLLAAGCGKRTEGEATETTGSGLERVVTNRMQDATYRKALDQNRQEQSQKAFERNEIVKKMEACISRARATLPAGADDKAVKAVLEKDPEWKVLEAKNAQAIGEIEKTLAKARETIRQRMQAEARDVKAVAEGRAVAVDPQSAK